MSCAGRASPAAREGREQAVRGGAPQTTRPVRSSPGDIISVRALAWRRDAGAPRAAQAATPTHSRATFAQVGYPA